MAVSIIKPYDAGAVRKTGDTMTDNLAISRSNNYPTLFFIQAEDAATHPQAMIQPSIAGTQPKFGFYQKTGSGSAWEGYQLPATTEALDANVNYDILTTKTFNAPEDFTNNSSAIEYAVAGYAKKCTRQGRICTIEYMSDSVAASLWTQGKLLFTLKAGYRPTITYYVAAAITSTPNLALVQVGQDGTVRFYSANGTLTDNPRLYLSFSYFCT